MREKERVREREGVTMRKRGSKRGSEGVSEKERE